MSLFEIISKISFCLIVAALLGFVIGWLFGKLQKAEKAEQKYNTLYEAYELKLSDIKQLQEELAHKDESLLALEQQYRECEKERLNAQMEEVNCDRYLRQIKELESENEMLISQIKEQKICEDENQLLKDEIKILEDEKEVMLEKIEECKTYEQNYKDLIVQVEALKSEREKLLQAKEQESTRIFTQTEQATPLPTHFEQIKTDLLHLKEEVKKLKSQKVSLKQKVASLQKKLSRKKSALQNCQTRLQQLQSKYDKSGTQTQNLLTSEEHEEIKTLSQLIRDTLDDIQK